VTFKINRIFIIDISNQKLLSCFVFKIRVI